MAVDQLLLVNAMVGQFITGFAARSFVVVTPSWYRGLGTLPNNCVAKGLLDLPGGPVPANCHADLQGSRRSLATHDGHGGAIALRHTET